MVVNPDIFSLLSSYAIYHRNPINAFIHVIWVPFLTFSTLGLLEHVTFHKNPLLTSQMYEINILLIISLLASSIYISLEIPSGVIFIYLF